MRATLRQILVVAAGVLLAATYVAACRAFSLEMDWKTVGVGAFFLFGIVYVLGKEA